MATHKLNFTKTALEKITPPTVASGNAGRGGVYDTFQDLKEKGLVLLVSNGGAKTYYLYSKINGRPERVRLGAFADLSVEQARKMAAMTRGEIACGSNPQASKRVFRQEATFKELFDEYLERYSKKHKRSWQYDEREVNKFLKSWFPRKISSFTMQEIQRLHERIRDDNGLYQANRLLERIRAMFNKAIEWGWQGKNPAVGIRKFKEKSRDRFLQPHELPSFFEALHAEQNEKVRDFIFLSLLTGARKSNMLAMRWDQISFDQRHWRIPETKNGEPVTVPLSPQALEVLQARRKASPSTWVFPSESSAKGYLQDPKKAWQRLLKRAEIYQLIDHLMEAKGWSEAEVADKKLQAEANLSRNLSAHHLAAKQLGLDVTNIGLPDIRLHDLRRSLGSWQAVTGASSYVIGKSLGHKSQQATAIYARLNLDPVRESVEKATAAMLAAGGR